MREGILMVKLAAICAALFSCLAHPPASASVGSGQPSFTVRVLSANGSGCPPGTAEVSRGSSPELTVTYSRFIAAAGDGAAPADFRKNCQVDVSVIVPSGWTYGLSEADYQGFASMGTGAHGSHSTYYYFAGQPQTYQLPQHLLSGPRNGDYKLTGRPHVAGWAPCHFSATLNVNTSVLMFAGPDKSFLNGLAMDDSLRTTYHLGFKRC
jgi:hypothetical protein